MVSNAVSRATIPVGSSDASLQVRNLSVWFGDSPRTGRVVDGVSFDLEPGKVLGVAGESGSGKTMTALAVLGLLPRGGSASGTVQLGSQNILSLRGRELRKIQGRTVAMVFQDPTSALHPMLTVGQQLTEHMRYHLGVKRSQAEQRAMDLLDQVRIPNPRAALREYPHQFSGGMRQRIQIAIALACGPQVLIADEPTTALDVTVQAGVLALLNQLCRESNLAVMLITHDLGVLASVSDRVLVMYAGRVVEGGTADQLISQTRHPYTRGLLDALPHPSARQQSLVPIQGSPATPASRPPGCAFHPRCAYATLNCRAQVPDLVDIGEGHLLACGIDPFSGQAAS